MARSLIGQTPKEHEVLVRHAELLRRSLPRWNARGRTKDDYCWYHGSLALKHLRDAHWNARSKADFSSIWEKWGAWDPDGPWGFAGGRITMTAFCALSLAHLFDDRPPR